MAGLNEATLQKIADDKYCKYLSLNIQDVTSYKDFIKKVDQFLGGINCLVNNAGISLHEEEILHVSPEDFDVQINTNFKGAFFLSKAFIAKCNEKKEDCVKNILFVTSETGITLDERPYGLTKAALNSLVQGLAYRLYRKVIASMLLLQV